MLCPDDIRRACAYKASHDSNSNSNSSNWKQPVWRGNNMGKQQYCPSYNIAPSANTPVLVSGKHFKDDNEDITGESRVIQSMRWGLIPSWYKDKPSAFSLSTNNCRSESFLDKPLYKNPVSRGRRCAIICEGYYEWKTVNKTKQPYLIHNIQPENVILADEKWHNIDKSCTNNSELCTEWKGPRLLYLAGVFDVCHPKESEEPVYSYSVLTMDSSKELSWLHHRMPVVLDTDDAVQDWLDFESLPVSKVQHLIKHPKELKWYPVSDSVNNSRNNFAQCIIAVDEKKLKLSAESNMMMAWLKKDTNKSETGKRKLKSEVEEQSKKILKTDNPS
ncbi:Embryonic stem cell-specific 5-hydroxymethylcytosine-binding protein [Nymphon striatum]|nr:Embryonic stem cell-specific 5-hydroxymethylcytosine-binding protein [Nymphon striatum]